MNPLTPNDGQGAAHEGVKSTTSEKIHIPASNAPAVQAGKSL